MRRTSEYRSKFEAAVAASLKKRGLPFNYEEQALLYRIEATYTPDFCLPNGVVVETKGHFPPEDRRKMLAVKAQHPELDIRLCFQNADVRLSRAPKALTYWQWAERHGFTAGDYPKHLRVQPVTSLTMKPFGPQPPKHFNAAMFEGLLTCVDPERLHAAVLNGVGRGKAFGMGLLSLAVVR